MLAVHGFHPRVIALEERAISGELRAHRLIAGIHAKELVAKGGIHLPVLEGLEVLQVLEERPGAPGAP
jgi:hypothetical protein